VTRAEKVLLALGLGFMALAVGSAAGCYAHTPTPSCSANPYQPQCPPPIHDERPPR